MEEFVLNLITSSSQSSFKPLHSWSSTDAPKLYPAQCLNWGPLYSRDMSSGLWTGRIDYEFRKQCLQEKALSTVKLPCGLERKAFTASSATKINQCVAVTKSPK